MLDGVRIFLARTKGQSPVMRSAVAAFAFVYIHPLADGNGRACPLWRYPDLGPHLVFISNVIRRTLTEQMREESRYLRSHIQARQAIKEVVEIPDHQADRLLRSIEQNKGALSHVLAKEMPVLATGQVWAAITEAVARAFRDEAPIDSSVIDRYSPNRPAG